MTSSAQNLKCSKLNDSLVEAILAEYFPYIVSLAQVFLNSYFKINDPISRKMVVDEVSQNALINFWLALQKRSIGNYRSYIHSIVRHEYVNIIRQFVRYYKAFLPLETDEDGEIHHGKWLVACSEGMDDPELEYEQKSAAADYLDQIIQVVLELPPRQKQAMITSLIERVDDLVQLVDAFKLYDLDIGEFEEWPEDEIDVHRLKGSISHARRTIAQHMDVTLLERKKTRGVHATPLSCICDVEDSL